MVSDEFDLEIQRGSTFHLNYCLYGAFPSSRVENDLNTYIEPNLKIQICNLETLKIIFHSLVQSHIFHGLCIYKTTSEGNYDKILSK